jgi:serine/threonine protein kinase
MPEEENVLDGRYELGEPLGRGGMATVYLGTDRVLGRTVAVKVLTSSFAEDESFVRRFRREARAAAGLSHPGVVAVFDTGSDDGTHYIVMEHVEGRTLADVIREDGPLEPSRAAEVAEAVCDALAFAHAQGLVHRDIKPANIMVTPGGQVKVMDFGIARTATDDTLTKTAIVLGTANYLSPEQAEGKPVDARTDLYSLGVVLYEALTGRPPFSGTSPVAVATKHVQKMPEPPGRVRAGIPPAVEAVVMKALEKDPDARFADATQMRRALEAARGASTDPLPSATTSVLPPQPTAPLRPRHAGPVRRWPIAAAIAAVIVALVALVAILANSDSSPLPKASHSTRASSPPSTSSSPSSPPVKTTPTFGEASAAFTALLDEGSASGAIDKHAADDLQHHLDDVAKELEKGDTEKIADKISELQDKVAEHVDKGEVDASFAPRLEQAVKVLAASVGISTGGDGGN